MEESTHRNQYPRNGCKQELTWESGEQESVTSFMTCTCACLTHLREHLPFPAMCLCWTIQDLGSEIFTEDPAYIHQYFRTCIPEVVSTLLGRSLHPWLWPMNCYPCLSSDYSFASRALYFPPTRLQSVRSHLQPLGFAFLLHRKHLLWSSANIWTHWFIF